MHKPTIKGGLAGSGFAARFHFDALTRVHGVELQIAGIWSPTAPHAEAFGRERGIPVLRDYDELLQAVDVVHLCTPPASHEPLALRALAAGRWVVIEKPLTGYFGDGSESFSADGMDRRVALKEACASIERLLAAERRSRGRILYAENWVYAPAIQKEREILEKTGGQILWMLGGESHSGSHSPTYGLWRFSGGGSLMGKACHPLAGALYLKQVEGRARDGRPIRPATVSCRTHAITRMPAFGDEGHLRTGYHDVEDFAQAHVVFDDGTVADLFASELVLGGVHNFLEVAANNHRARININPNDALLTYNPVETNFSDIYVVEKIGTKQGWAPTSPDEAWFTGYQHEMEAFYRAVARDEAPESGGPLGADCIATIYAAYVSAQHGGLETPVPRL